MASLPYKAGGLLMPFNDKHHLFAVMNDPCADKQCLLAMVTTIYAHWKHDDTCVLNAGDHPFITHPSYVLYRRAETVRAWQIANMLSQGYYVAKEDFDAVVFKRIADGFYKSEQTRGRIIAYAKANGV